jgi:hypothetical protein
LSEVLIHNGDAGQPLAMSQGLCFALKRAERPSAESPYKGYHPELVRGRAAPLAQLLAQSQARVADVFGMLAGESGDLGRWEGADT